MFIRVVLAILTRNNKLKLIPQQYVLVLIILRASKNVKKTFCKNKKRFANVLQKKKNVLQTSKNILIDLLLQSYNKYVLGC